MSLFSVLSVGTKGLAASQLGMDVTGQNISNADVPGYSRKRINVSADYHRDGTFGQMGFGVEVKNIERLRDSFIDQQIQRQNQELGVYTEHDTALEKIENIFTEPGDAGLQSYLDRFFDSWQNLANNPADPAARTMVKTNADMLVNIFHSLSGELRELRTSMNTEIQGRVDKVNKISKEVFNLNQEIATVEIGGQNANDSRDRRDLLLKELSSIIDISVTENEQGQVSVATGGSLIVSPVFAQELETMSTSTELPDGTTQITVGVRFKTSKLTYNPTGGQLKGLFEVRDRVIPSYQEKLDALAITMVSKVNEQHERGYNLMGYSGFQFFAPEVTGASDIALSQSISSDVRNIAAASGGGTVRVLNTAVTAPALNFGGAPISLPKVSGVIPPAPLGANVARNIIDGSVVVRNGATVLRENIDYHIDYVQGTIQMLNNLNDGAPITLDYEYNTGGFKGPGDNANALSIAQLRQNATMTNNALGNPTATFVEFYSSFIGQLGLKRSEAESNVQTREYLVEQYQTHQDAISGVSLDEEMANMTKYQHTYAAAARLISITSQMLDVLMNL